MAASCALSRAALPTTSSSCSNPTSRLEISNRCSIVPSRQSSVKKGAVACQSDVSATYGRVAAIQRIASRSPVLYFQSALHKRTVNRLRTNTVCASAGSEDDTSSEKAPFGYTRKDVLVLGLGVIVAGFALKYGLEAVGVDPLVAGNVIQISFVLGLMVLWVFTYVFRVANKEMTYVKQLKSYEEEVMKKRLEELPEAELENMLAAVEEEKRRLEERRKAGQQ